MSSPATTYRRRPRVVAGIEMPRETDLRTVFGRRFTRLIRAYSAELGDNLNEPDRALIRQVCSLQLRIEQLDGRDDASADEVIRLSSEHRRLLTALRARASKTKPSGTTALQEYLASRSAQAVEAPEANEEL
jgi:hypothetical protein